MSADFRERFDGLARVCPFDIKADTAQWAKWMQGRGYDARLHGDLLNGAIVDSIRTDAQPAPGEFPALSRRDYAAIHIMAGLAGDPEISGDVSWEAIAVTAVGWTDALLAQLTK